MLQSVSLCVPFLLTLRLLLLPALRLWTCLHSILPRAYLSANLAAMLFRLLLFLAISKSTTLTMRVMLLQNSLPPLNHKTQLVCLPTIFASDTNSSIQQQ
jgi:hypothetical protein